MMHLLEVSSVPEVHGQQERGWLMALRTATYEVEVLLISPAVRGVGQMTGHSDSVTGSQKRDYKK